MKPLPKHLQQFLDELLKADDFRIFLEQCYKAYQNRTEDDSENENMDSSRLSPFVQRSKEEMIGRSADARDEIERINENMDSCRFSPFVERLVDKINSFPLEYSMISHVISEKSAKEATWEDVLSIIEIYEFGFPGWEDWRCHIMLQYLSSILFYVDKDAFPPAYNINYVRWAHGSLEEYIKERFEEKFKKSRENDKQEMINEEVINEDCK